MPKYFAIVPEDTGNIDRGHLCYCGNDEDMDKWRVDPGYKLVELMPEEYTALTELDIKVNRDEKEVVIQAEEVTENDQIKVVKKYDLDANKLEKYVQDRPMIDVPIEIDGMGGKEIIGYEQKPEGIVVERKKDIEIIKAKSELEK